MRKPVIHILVLYDYPFISIIYCFHLFLFFCILGVSIPQYVLVFCITDSICCRVSFVPLTMTVVYVNHLSLIYFCKIYVHYLLSLVIIILLFIIILWLSEIIYSFIPCWGLHILAHCLIPYSTFLSCMLCVSSPLNLAIWHDFVNRMWVSIMYTKSKQTL